MNENIKLKLSLLPDSPGCYLMREKGEIIYVGKAVNLKNRVRSYFIKQEHTPKVSAMVARVDDFDIMLCASNLEALMLECNLIKLHRPYYNILLKDDKHYPYLRFPSKEPFPRLTVTRRVENDGAAYFGPYIGASSVRQVLLLLRKIYPLRTCSMKLPVQKPVRPCAYYEIGQCLGPCAHKCTEEEYAAVAGQVISFLKGQYKPIMQKLEDGMRAAAAGMQFERAAELRDAMRDIEGLMEQQNVLSTRGGERDIIALAQDGLDAMAQVLFIRGGKMIGGDAFTLPREGREDEKDVLDGFLLQFYESRKPAREVLVSAVSDVETLEGWLRERAGHAVDVIVPRRGSKKELVDMAKKNALDALAKRNARQQIKEERTVGAARELAKALGLQEAPRRIEGFDISNTQGQQSVASMVVFIDGEPSKKDYRHFRIKTVEGANDFASMNEVLSRRFLRARAEKEEDRWPLPDLVLVDGGPEQLAFARRAMLAAGANVPMFGLAKKQEEIFLPDRESPILLDRRSPALHLIQFIRDESHRFAITHHRGLREKNALHSRLEDVPGIGKSRRRALLSHFRTMKAISEAGLDDLKAVSGMTEPAALALYRALHKTETGMQENAPLNR